MLEAAIFGDHRDAFDFDEKFRATQMGLDAGAGGVGVETLLIEEGVANFIELVVMAEIVEVTGEAYDVVPVGALAL